MDFGEWTIITEPTCTEDGLKQHICNKDGYIEEVIVPATGHTEKVINKKDATCAEDGYTGDKVCSVCNEIIEVGHNTEKLGHDFSDNTQYCKHGCGTRNENYFAPTTTQPTITTTTTQATTTKPSTSATTTTTTAVATTESTTSATIQPTTEATTTQPTTVPATTAVPVVTTTQPATVVTTQATTAQTVVTTQKQTTTKAPEKNSKKQKNTKVKKATPAKASATISWSKVKGIKGYEVQLATDKKFKKNKKTVTIKKQKTTKTTVKKLKAKKTYYVRIRTYTTKKVNGKSTKVYSSWSKVKSVKTK